MGIKHLENDIVGLSDVSRLSGLVGYVAEKVEEQK